MSANLGPSSRMIPGSAPALMARPLAAGGSQRLVSEDDVRSERERWMQTSMHEVWNLENAAFERINNQLEEAAFRLKEEVTQAVMSQIEDEKLQRIEAVNELRAQLKVPTNVDVLASLRRDVAAVQAAVSAMARSQLGVPVHEAGEAEAAIRALKSEVDMRAAQHQASSGSIEARFEEFRLQMSSTEVAMQSQRSELQAATTLCDLRQVVRLAVGSTAGALWVVFSEQGARGSAELSRGLQELSFELQKEVKQLRSEMESLEHQCRRLATSSSAESAPTESLLGQMQDVQLDFQRLSQDLRDERNERCRSLADVNRLVESVAVSTSATIQDAEQRLSTQISKSAPGSGGVTPNLNFSGGCFGGGSTSPGLHRQDLDVSVSGDVRGSLGS
ncbi:unnamed protein product, partial [Polarella glacialis]